MGSSISPDLASKISNGYLTPDGISIAALTIQRFRSSRGNVYVTTDTYFKNNANSRDTTKYKFNGEEYGKGPFTIFFTIKFILCCIPRISIIFEVRISSYVNISSRASKALNS